MRLGLLWIVLMPKGHPEAKPLLKIPVPWVQR